MDYCQRSRFKGVRRLSNTILFLQEDFDSRCGSQRLMLTAENLTEVKINENCMLSQPGSLFRPVGRHERLSTVQLPVLLDFCCSDGNQSY